MNLPYTEINNEKIYFRKWKGKDKSNFLKLFKDKDQKLSLKGTIETLVTNVLESHQTVNFSYDEYRYLLSRIRQASLGEDLSVPLTCEDCQENFILNYQIQEVVKPVHSTLDEFNKDGISVRFGQIKNRDYYLDAVEEDPAIDIFYRIAEINDNDAFSLEDLTNFLEELDLDTQEELLEHFELNKFRVDDFVDVECPHCKNVSTYVFDDMPGFFPDSWFEDALQELVKQHYQGVKND